MRKESFASLARVVAHYCDNAETLLATLEVLESAWRKRTSRYVWPFHAFLPLDTLQPRRAGRHSSTMHLHGAWGRYPPMSAKLQKRFTTPIWYLCSL
jgi:hypothetical protein